MASKTDTLRDIFLDLEDSGTVTEHQEDGPSHEPVEHAESELLETVSDSVTRDGLDDAVDGLEASG